MSKQSAKKTKEEKRRTARDRMRRFRARMRAQGYRLVQMWLPDTRTPEFKTEAHRQSMLVNQSSSEQEYYDFMRTIFAAEHDEGERKDKRQ